MNVHTHGHMRIKLCEDLSELAVNSLHFENEGNFEVYLV